jgi:transcriptional regulator with XRE-family HTH domain
MITIEQCRAARGLLDWTQQDLSDASGLSKTAINNFEKGHSDIKYESLRAVRMAFESADVEFVDQGVRRRDETARILKGPNAWDMLLDDIRDTVKNAPGIVLAAGPDTLKTMLEEYGIDAAFASAKDARVIYGSKIATEIGGLIVIIDSPEAAKNERLRFETPVAAELRAQKNRAF